MKWLMIYESEPEGLALARQHFPAHRALLDEFHVRGTLLMAGPAIDDPERRAFGVWTDPAEAEAFMARDPFILNGVVARRYLYQWNEVLA
jgi:uncharacterized protein YciI